MSRRGMRCSGGTLLVREGLTLWTGREEEAGSGATATGGPGAAEVSRQGVRRAGVTTRGTDAQLGLGA